MINIEDSINEFIMQSNPLNTIPTLEILDKLEKYRRLDLKRISDNELFKLTLETVPVCNISCKCYRSGTKLYRVREYLGNEFTKLSELLYVPSKLVKTRGRLNDVGESILYVSLDPVTPFHEVKAKVGKSYCVITYEICEEEQIQVSTIGENSYWILNNLNSQGEINSKIIDQFFYTEFTKEVGKGTEYLYRTSTMLAKNFFDIPNSDGYEYPSVAVNRNINLAIKPDSVDKKVKVVGVENITIKSITDKNIEFDRISVATHITKDGEVIYYKI